MLTIFKDENARANQLVEAYVLFEGKDEEVTTALESDNTRLIELHQETLLG